MKKLIGLGLVVSIFASTPAQTFFSQRDGRWAGQFLGSSIYTVGGFGCAMTSAAMVLSAGGANVDPGRLNAFLTSNGGYTNGLIKWNVAAQYDGSGGVTWFSSSSITTVAKLKSIIDQGYGVVATSRRFSSGHFVMIKGYVGGGTAWSDFQYLDPWDLSHVDRRVGDAWVKAGNGLRLFKKPTGGGGGGGNSQLFVSESSEVGEGQVGFHRYGPSNWWSRSTAYGEGGHMFYTKNNDVAHGISNMADWKPLIGESRNYEVFVYIPRQYGTTTCARYEIYHANGRTDVQLNQLNYSDVWVSLGTYRFNQGSSGTLRLIDVTSEGHLRKFIAFDAAKWEPR